MSLANEILDRWAPNLSGVGLKTGTKGRFEVDIDGEPIFSKLEQRRFPRPGEVVDLLNARLGRPVQWRSHHT